MKLNKYSVYYKKALDVIKRHFDLKSSLKVNYTERFSPCESKIHLNIYMHSELSLFSEELCL